MKRRALVCLIALSIAAGMLAGCGVQTGTVTEAWALNGIGGMVHGGQQPVSGATIQLYTVGTTGDGSAATPLISATVTTNANGAFTITGDYSCAGATQVYLVATGGNPGLSGNNPNLAMMTTLGPCSGLTPTTFISVNELTTVAAVAALYPYMNSFAAIGSGTSDASALAAAFSLSAEYVDPSAGTTPGNNIPTGMSVPVTEINTLADMLAACVNSTGGVSGQNNNCGTLFSLTTPSAGVAPTDTIAAVMNLEKNPTLNTMPLTNLAAANAPYQPTLTAPPADYSVALNVGGVVSATGSVTFAAQPVGSLAPAQIVTLINTTASAVSIGGVSLNGANAGDFTEVSSCPAMLGKGLSCTVSVTFMPSAAGTRSAALQINANGGVGSAALSGTGVMASTGPVTLSPTSLSFVVPTIAQTVTLSNFGSAPLGITAINISSNFTETNDCGSSLSGQSICHIFVSASSSPSTLNPGSFTGTLSVIDTDTTDAQTVQLSSTIADISSTRIRDWGVYTVGETSPAQLFNSGVSLSSMPYTYSVPVNDLQGGGWTSVSCQVTFNQSCNASASFVPTQTGPIYGTAYGEFWTGYGAENVSDFSISTTAVGPVEPIQPVILPSVLGGNGSASGGSTSVTFYVKSLSSLPVTLNAPTFATIGGNLPNEFYMSQSNCSILYPTVSFQPNPSCFITVTFISEVYGPRTTTMTLTDRTGTAHSVQLQAYGSYPAPIAVSTLSLSAAIGASSTQNVYGFQANFHPLLATLLSSSNPAFSLPGATYCDGQSQPCAFPVMFTPTVASTVTGTLLLTDPATGNTFAVALSGTGNAITDTVSPGSLAFAPRSVGTTSLPQAITVTNTGALPLTFTSVVISGGNTGDYSQTNNCFPSVAVGGSCTIMVSNTPSVTGQSSSSVVITTNAAGSPQTVTLSGLGQ